MRAVVLALLVCGCSIEPQVTVEKPVVNVTLCLSVAENKVSLVECDAGDAVPLSPDAGY